MCEKALVQDIFLQALLSVMPKHCIPAAVSYHDNILRIEGESFDLRGVKNLYIYGSGKASIEMAEAMQKLLKGRIKESMVVSNYAKEIAGVKVIESTHPLPSRKSIDAGEALIRAFEGMGEEDFFIYLLSGGSSALIEKPVSGVSLEDFQAMTEVLLHQGLSIDEMNVLRKNFSEIKGGGLAAKTAARGVVLVVSDVIGDDLQSIGSAPLLANNSTLKDLKEIINKYNILHLLPSSIKDILENDDIIVKKEIPSFPHFVIASNAIALQKAQALAIEMGLSAVIVTDRLEGDVKEVADFIVRHLQDSPEELLIFGGESTVKVKGKGLGGRNQELCLWVLKRHLDITFLSAGSDGIDGNSDAAGAVVCRRDYHDSIDDYLAENDSYHYLKNENSLIMIGESGTNVMDIMIALKTKTKGGEDV